MSKVYTAHEMRETAKLYEARAKTTMEVCSRRGGSATVTVFASEGISDHKVAAMLRQAASAMEREAMRKKKYEYSAQPADVYGVYQHRSAAELNVECLKTLGVHAHLVRREVGEWQEVKE